MININSNGFQFQMLLIIKRCLRCTSNQIEHFIDDINHISGSEQLHDSWFLSPKINKQKTAGCANKIMSYWDKWGNGSGERSGSSPCCHTN